MSDKLVFDLAQEVEGTPNVFVRKDWINILDNQNQNYNNNQSVIDTSQLSNSNKYMSYREAYFSIPLTLSLKTEGDAVLDGAPAGFVPFLPAGVASAAGYMNLTSADYAIGLKNWFGQIIHSFTLDYNGTTIVQQTPFVNMWNSFKLITSLSYSDIRTQGATIGFYPDDSTSWTWTPPQTLAAQVPVALSGTGYVPAICAWSPSGTGICNNTNFIESTVTDALFANGNSGRGNIGLAKRQSYINFDGDAISGSVGSYLSTISTNGTPGAVAATSMASYYAPYGNLLSGSLVNAPYTGTQTTCNLLWKSYIFNKINQAVGVTGMWQCAVVATVYLKHIHSFFNMCPLLKGVFMKMTMNLNNTSTSFETLSCATTLQDTGLRPLSMVCQSVANPLGGINPLMVASGDYAGSSTCYRQSTSINSATTSFTNCSGGFNLFGRGNNAVAAIASALIKYRMNVSVGSVVLDNSFTSASGAKSAPLSKSIYLYIPAYTFNPVFEQAYLSSPVKQIKYTDIYQYQVLNVASGSLFNNLLTNGISNIKSVLILPFFSSTGNNTPVQVSPIIAPAGAIGANPTYAQSNGVNYTFQVGQNTAITAGLPVWQSPFDVAGSGPTSPLCSLTNFNVQISGQNAIYNIERYNFEQWNNQLYGQNAVNGGLTDGLTSGLIDRVAFDNNYCYYYVNVERMLPVEQSVPKSVQIIGQNLSSRALDLYCFIEYGVDISIDALTGARV